MESTGSAGLTFQPSYYGSEVQTGYVSQNYSEFTFVDFLPECRAAGGIFAAPEYESFQTLIDRANDWLRANRRWKITTCESVEFKVKGNMVNPCKMSYAEHNDYSTCYIRGLRLWLAEREDDSKRQQQIGYLNLIPRQVETAGIFSSASFETLDEVIASFNSMVQSNPLPGRVITIESQEMKLPSLSNLQPDRSHWTEQGDRNKHFLFIIRIFYEVMTGNPEEIGVKDFIPNQVTCGGLFSYSEYEPFSSVVRKASDWCSRQQGIRFCNAQSLEIKVKTGKYINSQKMDYTEHGITRGRTPSHPSTYYLRILRIAYTKLPASQHSNHEKHFPHLTCKTFMPVQLKGGLFSCEYETLEETIKRVTAWVKATGARILNAETAALRTLNTSSGIKLGTEATYIRNQTHFDERWIIVIRLYLLGVYNEPPQEMLPPIPKLESEDCCVIL